MKHRFNEIESGELSNLFSGNGLSSQDKDESEKQCIGDEQNVCSEHNIGTELDPEFDEQFNQAYYNEMFGSVNDDNYPVIMQVTPDNTTTPTTPTPLDPPPAIITIEPTPPRQPLPTIEPKFDAETAEKNISKMFDRKVELNIDKTGDRVYRIPSHIADSFENPKNNMLPTPKSKSGRDKSRPRPNKADNAMDAGKSAYDDKEHRRDIRF